MAIKGQLENLRNRYFRSVIKYPDGEIVHHGDCKIYRSKKIYGFSPCTCGLLHDLSILNSSIIEIIYPQYWNEDVSSDMSYEDEEIVKKKKESGEWQKYLEETNKLINDIFGKTKKVEVVQITDLDIIIEVFGKEFTDRKVKEYYERHNKTL